MSLVMEALRRVEKPGTGPGTIGAAVASYTRTPPRRGAAIPLLLGLVSGGAAVFLFEPPSVKTPAADEAAVSEAPKTRRLKGGAGLPPPLILAPSGGSSDSRPVPSKAATDVAGTAGSPGVAEGATAPTPRPVAPLILQAISERDSQPIAVINDQLVRAGDRIGLVRVLRIGPDFVEVAHENGRTDTVRFPPPPPVTSPTPDPR